ncbi:MAG: NAD-binding protein [Candidatus Omnitrophica bacterium]|nr:NAD-binding protein [Candidatus Omnitrophota bacterium]
MYVIIVGAGNVGHYLAHRLFGDKHMIALVEKDRAMCDLIGQELDILVVNGDGCEISTLQAAGIERADVLAAVTGSDEDNLVICQLAKEVFHIDRTVARVNDSRNEHIFNELGVDVPIDSTGILARVIEEEVSLSDFVNLVTFRKGKLALVRFDLPADSPIISKKVSEVTLPVESVLVAIVRGDSVFIPRGDTVFKPQDEVVALTRIGEESAVLQTFLPEM